MKNTKPNPAKKALQQARDIRFVKEVAADYGISLTHEQALKAVKVCGNDYYRMKEYFNN
jgi:hypothetical protein